MSRGGVGAEAYEKRDMKRDMRKETYKETYEKRDKLTKRVIGEKRHMKRDIFTETWQKKPMVNPKSTSNQSSKLCSVLQYPSRKAFKYAYGVYI